MSLPPRTVVPESSLAVVEPNAGVVAIEPAQLDRHPVAVFVASLSPGSRRTMLSALKIIATMVSPSTDAMTFPWGSLDYAHTATIRTRLAESFAPATANKILAALRGVLKMSFRLGLISADQMTRATSFDPVRGSRVPKGRSITQGELRALFGICDPNTAIGARDAALLGIMYAGGLRRAEVVGLDLEHVDLESGAILVNGKGSKQRRVFVVNGALDAVKAWLQCRGAAPGPLLLPVVKGGRVVHRRMTDAALAERVRYLAKRAGVSALSPHDFRRSFVGEMLDLGSDLATVQALAGHSSPTTTAKYDRRGDRTKRRAAELLHVPFVPRGDR